MRRVLRGLVLRHRKSQRGQVKTGKQCLTLAEDNRCKCKLEGVDQPSLQILPHGGNTASDLDGLVTRCLFREPQRLFDSAADKVEGRPAFHHERLTLVVRQNESRRMVWRIGTPPSLPRVVLPWATDRTKHVATKDEGAKVIHSFPCEFIVGIDNAAFLPKHCAECLCPEEPLKDLSPPPTEWITQALLNPSAETVQRNTKSSDPNLWHLCSFLLNFCANSFFAMAGSSTKISFLQLVEEHDCG